MKITFGEFKQWHDNAWPGGYIWSGDTCMSDGRDIYDASDAPPEAAFNPNIRDDEIIDLDQWEGLELEDRENRPDDPMELDIAALIRRWRKTSLKVPLVIVVPKSELEEAKRLVAGKGWKIV